MTCEHWDFQKNILSIISDVTVITFNTRKSTCRLLITVLPAVLTTMHKTIKGYGDKTAIADIASRFWISLEQCNTR